MDLLQGFYMMYNDAFYGSFTNGTETFRIVRLHSAVHKRTVYALRLISAAFVDTDVLHVVSGKSGMWCRDRSSFGEHIIPLLPEVGKRRKVLFPWFYARKIELFVLVVIKILIAESAETVSELMDGNRQAKGVMGCCQGITVVDASTTVIVCICQDDDVFIGDSCSESCSFFSLKVVR